MDGCVYAVKKRKEQMQFRHGGGWRPDGQATAARMQEWREVHAMAFLSASPHFVRYYTAWREDNFLYIQTEICWGNLEDAVTGNRPAGRAVMQRQRQLLLEQQQRTRDGQRDKAAGPSDPVLIVSMAGRAIVSMRRAPPVAPAAAGAAAAGQGEGQMQDADLAAGGAGHTSFHSDADGALAEAVAAGLSASFLRQQRSPPKAEARSRIKSRSRLREILRPSHLQSEASPVALQDKADRALAMALLPAEESASNPPQPLTLNFGARAATPGLESTSSVSAAATARDRRPEHLGVSPDLDAELRSAGPRPRRNLSISVRDDLRSDLPMDGANTTSRPESRCTGGALGGRSSSNLYPATLSQLPSPAPSCFLFSAGHAYSNFPTLPSAPSCPPSLAAAIHSVPTMAVGNTVSNFRSVQSMQQWQPLSQQPPGSVPAAAASAVTASASAASTAAAAAGITRQRSILDFMKPRLSRPGSTVTNDRPDSAIAGSAPVSAEPSALAGIRRRRTSTDSFAEGDLPSPACLREGPASAGESAPLDSAPRSALTEGPASSVATLSAIIDIPAPARSVAIPLNEVVSRQPPALHKAKKLRMGPAEASIGTMLASATGASASVAQLDNSYNPIAHRQGDMTGKAKRLGSHMSRIGSLFGNRDSNASPAADASLSLSGVGGGHSTSGFACFSQILSQANMSQMQDGFSQFEFGKPNLNFSPDAAPAYVAPLSATATAAADELLLPATCGKEAGADGNADDADLALLNIPTTGSASGRRLLFDCQDDTFFDAGRSARGQSPAVAAGTPSGASGSANAPPTNAGNRRTPLPSPAGGRRADPSARVRMSPPPLTSDRPLSSVSNALPGGIDRENNPSRASARSDGEFSQTSVLTAVRATDSATKHRVTNPLAAQYIEQRYPVGEDDLLLIIDHTSKALAYMHERSMVHLDVKPSNILVCYGCGPGLCDIDGEWLPEATALSGLSSLDIALFEKLERLSLDTRDTSPLLSTAANGATTSRSALRAEGFRDKPVSADLDNLPVTKETTGPSPLNLTLGLGESNFLATLNGAGANGSASPAFPGPNMTMMNAGLRSTTPAVHPSSPLIGPRDEFTFEEAEIAFLGSNGLVSLGATDPETDANKNKPAPSCIPPAASKNIPLLRLSRLRQCLPVTYKLGDLGQVSHYPAEDVTEGDSRYLSRELLQGDTSCLPAADIFALGLTIYELASGRPLPTGDEPWQTLRDGIIDNQSIPHVSAPFAGLLREMIHPVPSQRPTAAQLSMLLETVIAARSAEESGLSPSDPEDAVHPAHHSTLLERSTLSHASTLSSKPGHAIQAALFAGNNPLSRSFVRTSGAGAELLRATPANPAASEELVFADLVIPSASSGVVQDSADVSSTCAAPRSESESASPLLNVGAQAAAGTALSALKDALLSGRLSERDAEVALAALHVQPADAQAAEAEAAEAEGGSGHGRHGFFVSAVGDVKAAPHAIAMKLHGGKEHGTMLPCAKGTATLSDSAVTVRSSDAEELA